MSSRYPDVIIVDSGEMWEEEKRYLFFQRPTDHTDDEWDEVGDYISQKFLEDTGELPIKTIGSHKFWETTK